jgi:hypothetical protein
MGFYLGIILIPSLLMVLCSKFIFHRSITVKEWMAQIGVLLLSTGFMMALLGASAMQHTWDFNVLNGFVTEKVRDEVSCSHSYQCGETCTTQTTTDSKGKSSTRRVCSPKYCHEHSYDVDWDVKTTLGSYTIDRIDRRGLDEPKRWSSVYIGESVSDTESVRNYLLIDETRFKTDPVIAEKYKDFMVDYPGIYDYWHINRVVNDTSVDYSWMNNLLNFKLGVDGFKKQLNIIVVVTKHDADYYYALMEHWRGARKNDVILFFGIDDDKNVKWAKATAFADGQNNQVMLKQLQSMTYERKLDQDLIQEEYRMIVAQFNRVPNAEFAYMMAAWTAPTGWVVFLVILNMLITGGCSYYFIRNETF